MVNAKECDRCGKIYGDTKPLLFGEMGIMNRDNEKLDICPNCIDELEDWYSLTLKDFIKKYKK